MVGTVINLEGDDDKEEEQAATSMPYLCGFSLVDLVGYYNM